ncbi:hypothetical protein TcYC6_0081290 [Trypanosoma cruzi]|uniref:GPI transamidase component Tta1 n=1 Tax=Trypanosoma cruzi TaxID=5693 RepID=A0A7J6Y9R0_TRYCR|nr:hypothetical protein ECC02_003436 [Trypanosoma cruzi]KAF8297112.1 hypothetical protein TcYC6_0081290 [Trypanosoma cruzi]
MSVNFCLATGFFILFLCVLLTAFESWLRCDDVFGLDGDDHISVLRNGDAVFIDAVVNKGFFSQTNEGGNTSSDDPKASFSADVDTSQVLAVIVMSAPSLPEGVISSITKARLLHGVRTALLAGAPWIIVPGSVEERRSAEKFLWELRSPSEALFPDATLSELPAKVQKLAVQMRDSMSFDTSLKNWIRRGRLLKRLSHASYVDEEMKVEDMSSPRLLRYGAAEWILPGFLWGEAGQSEEAETMTYAEQAVRLMKQRLLAVHADFQNEDSKERPTEKNARAHRGCFNVIVVSSMHNERHARAMVYSTIRREWGASSPVSASQKSVSQIKQQEQQKQIFSECIHVLVTSAGDVEPTWEVPSPLFVRGPIQSMANFSLQSSFLARFLGVYAHAIHANYRRWFACMQVSLLSYGPLSLIYEICTIIVAHLTETLSVRDLAYSTFDRPN